jgi:hypothetical protein
MFDDATVAIATGAAGNMVAYLLSGQVDAARRWVARIFRQASKEGRIEAQKALDRDAASLGERSLTEAEAKSRWAMRIGGELSIHPNIRTDVAALAVVGAGAHSVHIESHHNEGSAPYVAGNNTGLIFSVVDGKRL